MSEALEQVARDFLAARELGDVDRALAFLSEDATFIDGPRGTHQGVAAIRAVLDDIAASGAHVRRSVRLMLSGDQAVMMERVDSFELSGNTFTYDIALVLEFDGEGRIRRWREYYDPQSIADQLIAAGVSRTES